MSFNFDFDQFKNPKFWCQAATEAIGTMLWVLIASQGDSSALNWAISYVVLTCALEGGHFNGWITVMRMIEGKNLDPIKGVFWLLCQALGAYLSSHLAAGLGMTAPSVAALEIGNWKDGLKEMFAVSFFMFVYLQDNSADMPRSFNVALAMVVSFWFFPATVFFPARQFASFASGFWVALLWGAIGTVVAFFKHKFMSCEGSSNDEVVAAEEKEEIVA